MSVGAHLRTCRRVWRNTSPSSNRMLAFPLLLLGLGITIGAPFMYESQPEAADPIADLALNEPGDAPPAGARPAAAASPMDWSAPADAESNCDTAVQEWLKAHNMRSRS